jgi:hypothetical protein
VLQRIGLPATDADAQKMIRLLDINGDDRISYDEFRRYVLMLPSAQVRCFLCVGVSGCPCGAQLPCAHLPDVPSVCLSPHSRFSYMPPNITGIGSYPWLLPRIPILFHGTYPWNRFLSVAFQIGSKSCIIRAK